MLKQDNKVLRRIERKVFNPHAQIVHDESPLPAAIAGQPRGDEPPRGTGLLEGFGEQSADELVRVAVPCEGYRGASVWAQGSPGGASLEQELHSRGGGGRGPAWQPVHEPVRGEFDAVLEGEGGGNEGVELLGDLVKEKC